MTAAKSLSAMVGAEIVKCSDSTPTARLCTELWPSNELQRSLNDSRVTLHFYPIAHANYLVQVTDLWASTFNPNGWDHAIDRVTVDTNYSDMG